MDLYNIIVAHEFEGKTMCHMTVAQELEGRTVVPDASQVNHEEYIEASVEIITGLRELKENNTRTYSIEKQMYRCEKHDGKVFYRIDITAIVHDNETASKSR